MKRIILSFLSLMLVSVLFAQVPQSFKYQTVVRATDGTALASQTVAFKISILQGSSSGSAVYVETFSVATNQFGLATFNIGQGTTTDDFTAIDWSSGLHWVKVEIDPAGGSAYDVAGTSQLLSVPYALQAKNIAAFDYNNLTNKPSFSKWDKDSTDNVIITGDQTIAGNKTFSGTTTVTSPVNATDAATKAYVDNLKNQIASLEDKLNSSGLIVKDIDGNIYNTVKIGNQVWMAENLRVTKYPDGTPIPMVTENSAWNALTITDRAYTFYNNNIANAKVWGGYYTWSTVTNGSSSNTNPSNIQGICPNGWHVPSDAEYQELELYIGMSPSDTSKTGISRGTNEGGKLKEAGLNHFWSPNAGATNETGFTGLPAGNRTFNSGFDNLNKYASFWTSRRGTGDNAGSRVLYYQYSTFGRYLNDNDNRTGISCRCLKNVVNATTSGGVNSNSSINNLSGNGVVTFGTVDANSVGFGAALYMASDGNYEEADADAVATMPCVALALETGTGTKKVLLQGYIRLDTWTLTPGNLIFISPTTGAITQTRPSTAGQQVQIIGYAVKSNTMFFNPNLMLIELK
jgi:uncharacterized protein (TIGR02145 family)